jgi:hypothetical protein
MDPQLETLLGCNPPEQASKLNALGFIKSGAEGVLVFPTDLSDLRKRSASGLRQMERIRPPVRWVISSLDQPTLLEFVEKRDQPAGKNTKHFTQSLLAQAVGLLDDDEDSDMRRGQFQ